MSARRAAYGDTLSLRYALRLRDGTEIVSNLDDADADTLTLGDGTLAEIKHIDDPWLKAYFAARAAKAIVREVRGLGHGSSKWHTARVIARQRVTEEAREGFAAFDEHRRPAWAADPDND